MIDFAKKHPEHLLPLLKRFLETTSEDDIYLANAVSMLPPEQVVDVATAAISLMRERADWCSAYQVIQSASAQFPEIFAAWRETILDSVRLEKVDESHDAPNVLHGQLGPIWRGSPAGLLDRIENIVRDSSLSGLTRRTFVGLIFGSEDWNRIRRMTEDVPVENTRPLYFAESECLENGFELNAESVRFLHGHGGYHLQFPDGFLPDRMTSCHPTYRLPATGTPQRFGGRSDLTCPNCSHPFAHFLTIDPVIPDCGVTTVKRLELIACIQCRVVSQFIRYSADGHAIDFDVEGECFDFPPQYLGPVEVSFAPTPGRWTHPRTGVHENRYRLNGPPDWYQAAEFPKCRTCHKRMPLLLEIPSGGPTENGGDGFMSGDGGTGYIYWCDGCRMSSLGMQCA